MLAHPFKARVSFLARLQHGWGLILCFQRSRIVSQSANWYVCLKLSDGLMYMYFQPSKQKACRVPIGVRCCFRDFHPQGRSTSGGTPRSLEWQCAYRNFASCLGCWNSTWQASMHVGATYVSRVSFPHVQLNLGTFIGTDHVRFISRISVSDGSSMAARTAHDRLWRRKVSFGCILGKTLLVPVVLCLCHV